MKTLGGNSSGHMKEKRSEQHSSNSTLVRVQEELTSSIEKRCSCESVMKTSWERMSIGPYYFVGPKGVDKSDWPKWCE